MILALAWCWLAVVAWIVVRWVWRHPEEWATIGKLFVAWVCISLTAGALMFLAYSCTTPAHAADRARFVRKADGRVTLMVEKEVMPNAARNELSASNNRRDMTRGASQVVAASPVILTYTIPAYQGLPGSPTCAPDATQPAYCDSVRVLGYRRGPHPWDTAAWVAAQQSGWFDPYIVRVKFVGGLAGADTIRLPLLPEGYGARVQAHNAAGWCACESNLVRAVTP